MPPSSVLTDGDNAQQRYTGDCRADQCACDAPGRSSRENGDDGQYDQIQAAKQVYIFTSSKHNDSGSGPRDGFAQLFKARFARASEGDQGKRLHESKLKLMTAPDGPLKGQLLFKEPFEFINTHKLWMATNHEPVIRGTDEGIWRRIHRINFTYQVPEELRILHLAEQIWSAESSGILNWALEGLKQWRAVGLKPPQSVVKATKDYRAEQNVFVRFLNDCLERDPQGKEAATTLYAAYKDWAHFSNEYVETSTRFGVEFSKLEGVTKFHSRTGTEYRGVKISPKANDFKRPSHNTLFRGTVDSEERASDTGNNPSQEMTL